MDMEKKRARHSQYFQPLEKGEGGYLAVTSPITDSGKLPVELPEPRDVNEKWLCTDYRLKRAEAASVNTFFGLDAIQYEFVNLGPGVLAALVGATHKLTMNSIWFDTDPPIKNWDNLPPFTININHELYKVVEEHTRKLCAASKNRWAVSITDIGGTLDVLARNRRLVPLQSDHGDVDFRGLLGEANLYVAGNLGDLF